MDPSLFHQKKTKELEKEILKLRETNCGVKTKIKLNFSSGASSAMNTDQVSISISGDMVKRKDEANADFTLQEAKVQAVEQSNAKNCSDKAAVEVTS